MERSTALWLDDTPKNNLAKVVEINVFRQICVQDEDINMISIDFGISIMILTYLKISKLQMY